MLSRQYKRFVISAFLRKSGSLNTHDVFPDNEALLHNQDIDPFNRNISQQGSDKFLKKCKLSAF